MPLNHASADRDTVAKALAAVRAEGRSALTAPEGKRIADAYGIAPPARPWLTTRTRRWPTPAPSTGRSS